MRLLPRSLFGQVLLALLLGLLFAQGAALWLALGERARIADRLGGRIAAQRIGAVLELMEPVDTVERARLAHALRTPMLAISLDDAWRDVGDASPETAALESLLVNELPVPLDVHVLLPTADEAATRHWPPDGALGRDNGPPQAGEIQVRRPPPRTALRYLVQARFDDGTVVTFRQHQAPPLIEQPLVFLGGIAAIVLVVSLLVALLVRRLTQPLDSFARAAAGLAGNLDQPALREQGPVEITRAARAFNRMQDELRRLIETRSQALAAVSHDLRLPLTRARLRLEQLDDGPLRTALENDIDEMDQMIGGTLDYLRAGRSSEARVPVDLAALLESVAADMEAVGVNVKLQLPPRAAVAPLAVRPQALARCLRNLVDNGARYGGGTVELRLDDDDDQVVIRVEDRGPGIPAAERERLFEPFVRLDSSRARHTGGTGLGLTIARAIARAHGGDVVIEPRIGGGTCVVLTLPRRERELAESMAWATAADARLVAQCRPDTE